MEIYKDEKYVTVTYKPNKNYIIFDWINMSISLDGLTDLHMKALDVVKAKGVKVLVAETSKAKSVLYPECIDWWSTEHVPRLDKNGINKIITIAGGNALTRLTNKSWQGATGGIDLYEVPTIEDAEKIMDDK